MKIIDAGHRDHPYTAREQIVDDPIGDEITGGLHDDSDAPCSSILLTQAVDDLVGDPLAHGIEQAFAARQDDAPGFFRQRAIG